MRAERENRRYLPGVALPSGLELAGGAMDLHQPWLVDADLVVVGTPMAGLRGMLERLAGCTAPGAGLCKGVEAPQDGDTSTGLLGHEIRARVAPGLSAGVLSGPSFALEVARGQPTALVAASEHASVREALVSAFHGPTPDGMNAFKGDPKLDDLIQKTQAEFDTGKQVSLTHDVIRYMTGQMYMVPRPVANRGYQIFWPAIGNVGLNERWAGNNAVWSEEYQNWWIDTTKAPFV